MKSDIGFVYIIQSQKTSKYYIGSTNNINNRLLAHNSAFGCVYTRNNGPWKLICYKKCDSINIARVEEKKIKSYKSGNAFRKIINGEVAEWLKAPHC